MAGINKVILVGNLGIDPEVRTLENGTKVARLRIATTEVYNKDGNKVEQTEWHTVTLWRNLADVAEKYLTKGRQVYIEGKLRTRSWKDAEGNDKYATEIVGDNMQMLGNKSSNEEGSARNEPAHASGGDSSAKNDGDSDDLPF